MSDTATKVGLAKTGRRRSNVYEALNNIREEITPKVREQVLLKPNFLSSHQSTRFFPCRCNAWGS